MWSLESLRRTAAVNSLPFLSLCYFCYFYGCPATSCSLYNTSFLPSHKFDKIAISSSWSGRKQSLKSFQVHCWCMCSLLYSAPWNLTKLNHCLETESLLSKEENTSLFKFPRRKKEFFPPQSINHHDSMVRLIVYQTEKLFFVQIIGLDWVQDVISQNWVINFFVLFRYKSADISR